MINANPTVTLSSNSSTCSGGTASFTITGAAGDIVGYTGIIGAPASPVTLDASGVATITVTGVTSDQTINLTNVSNPTTSCSGTLTNTETVTINANPTVSLSSNTSTCSGGTASFTITGAPGDIVDYTGITGSPASPVTLDASGVVTISVAGVTTDQTINLTNVTNPSTSCSGTLTNSETVTINANPTVSLSSNTSTCSGGTASFTITGAPGDIVGYTGIIGAPASPVTLDASGVATITVTGVTSDQTINLTNVSNPTTSCSGTLTNTETVTINANPTVSLSSNTFTCSGGTASFTITGAPGDIVDYTGITGSPASPVTLDASGVAIVTVTGAITDQTINLTNVTNPTTSCSGTLTNTETVTINASPTVLLSSNSSTCSGGTASFTITGTAGDIVDYTGVTGSPASPVTLGASGIATITVTGVTTDQTINLTNVTNPTTSCSEVLTSSETVTINASPTVLLSSNSSTCSGGTATFTITGTAGDIVDYTGIIGTPASPVILGALGIATITVAGVTTDQTINLTNVTNPTTSCSGVLSNTETVTINANPTVTLSSNISTCSGGTASFTITGTAGDIVDYTGITGSPASPVTLDTSGVAIVTVTGAITDQTINLTNVTNPTTSCSGTLTNTETVTINANPTVLLSSNTSTCSGGTATFTITGTAGDIVDYTGITGSPASPVTLDISGVAIVTVTGAITDQTINLTNVSNPTTSCSGVLSNTETVTINANPTVTLSSNISTCSGGTATFTITGTAGDIVDYTGVAGTPTSPVTLDISGVAIITVAGVITDQTINLTNVTNPTTSCSEVLTSSETVTINASRTVLLSSNSSTCSGGTATFTITGTAGDIVDYTGIIGTPASPVTLDVSGVAIITVAGVTTDQTINLTNVTNPTTSCSGVLSNSETVTINASPTVLLSSNSSTCSGGTATFTITGTAGDIVDYTGVTGSPASPVTLGASGIATITVTGVTTDQTINLTNVTNPTTSCSEVLTSSETVTINASPTVLLSSNSSTCSGGTASFTITGTAGDIVDYTGVTGSPASPVTLGASGIATITVTGVTTDQTINLTNVTNPTTSCSEVLTSSETVTINASPTVLLSSNSSTCSGGTATFTITGTTGDIVDYTGITGSPASPVTLDTSGVAIVTVTGAITDQTINLTNVTNPTTSCSGTLTNTETVTINANPTVLLSSNTSTCSGGTASFTITGAAGDIVDYTGITGLPASPVTLDISGVATVTVTGAITDQTINLTNVSNPTTSCSGVLSNTETVTINANPTVTLSSNSSTCSGGTASFTITGAPGDIVDYTGIAGTPASPVTLDVSGVAIITVAGVTTDQTINLTNVTNPTTSCSEVLTSSETVTINASPTVTLSSNTSTCSGGTATFTITGTTGDIVGYTGIIGAPASPVTLDASGVATIIVTGVTSDQTINLTNVSNPTTSCSGTLTNTETVTINANPTVILSSNTSTCSGGTATFTITGTTGDIVDYTGITGSPASPVTLDTSGVAIVIVTGAITDQTINLTNVTNPTTSCSGTLTNTETVTINANPTVLLSSNTSTCSGGTASFTITGTAGDIVDYTGITGSPASPVTLDASGVATVTVTGAITDQTINLTNVTNPTTSCSGTLTNTETVTINANPTVTLSSNSSACSGGTASFIITGTAGDIVDYTGITGSPASPVTLDASGVAIVTVTGAITDQTINLTNVTNPTTSCSGTLTNTETVTINANPTVLLSSNSSTCSGGTASFIITGTAGDIVDYTGITGTPASPVTLDASGVATITVTGVTTDQTINLTNVTNPTTSCSGVLSNSETVTINASPTVLLSSNSSTCSGGTASFTISGTAGDIVDYTGVTGSPASPVTLGASGIATITVTGVTTGQTINLTNVTNPTTSCSGVLSNSETVIINANPTVLLSSNTSTCSGGTATFTITGTAGDIVDYTGITGTLASPVTLGSSGVAIVTVTGAITDQTINLTNVTNPTTSCSGTLTNSETVTINANPTVTLSSNSSTCSGGTASFIITGTAGDIVDYTGITGSPASPVTLDASGVAIVNVAGVTTSQTINLTNVTNPTTSCSGTLTNTETVTINANPTVLLSSNSSTCSGGTAKFTITGTPGDIVDYTGITGSPASPVTLDASGVAIVTVTGAITDQTINLTNVTNPATSCSGTLTNTETVTINANPSLISLTGNSDICEGDVAIFTISGDPGNEVFYNINGGGTQQAILNPLGQAQISIISAVVNQTITLETIINPITTCSSLLGNTLAINVTPLVDASFNMLPNCNGATANVTGDIGGAFSFNPEPTDGASIDGVSGEVINAIPNTTYSVMYSVTGICNTDTEIVSFSVLPLPVVDLQDEFLICLDSEGNIINQPRIDSDLSIVDYLFEWTEISNPSVVLGTNTYYEPMVSGVYSVLVTNTVTGCSTVVGDINTITTVTSSIIPSGLNAIITSETFANESIIEVRVNEEPGIVYAFSLDGNTFESNGTNEYVFYNVTSGEHEVTATDVAGCGTISIIIFVVDYPLFFTPNNDGYNDTWQIIGLNNPLDAKVSIYDRYGKLLKQLNSNNEGWDGTLNGQALPSSDYWFTLEYRDPNNQLDTREKVFNGHFTLKR
ncbi:T9SS type B sorting domain-containing protein [Lacinutrix sp. WUR7]|uniref:T9SS type B sorting domain-containing protein n=1 Tax=Lacinutrix sp. WUR7 TaxID=2653681 RepID=UPI00351BFD7C